MATRSSWAWISTRPWSKRRGVHADVFHAPRRRNHPIFHERTGNPRANPRWQRLLGCHHRDVQPERILSRAETGVHCLVQRRNRRPGAVFSGASDAAAPIPEPATILLVGSGLADWAPRDDAGQNLDATRSRGSQGRPADRRSGFDFLSSLLRPPATRSRLRRQAASGCPRGDGIAIPKDTGASTAGGRRSFSRG